MFDIGFWELAVIAVIGIVVVGPDKLPEVVRSIMVMVRKIQRMFSDVRGDIERELHLDEVRRSVDEMDLQEHIRKLNQSVIETEKKVRSEGNKILQDIDSEVKAVEQSLQNIADERAQTAGGHERITQYEVPAQSEAEAERDSGIEHIGAAVDSPASDTLADTASSAKPS